MNDKRKDILKTSTGNIDEQMLMDYLEGRLTPEEQHVVERSMMESPFLNDAMEGLSGIKNKQKAAAILEELNRDIQQKTQSRHIRYNQLIPNAQTLAVTVTITVLLLVVLAFVIIKMSTVSD